MATDPELDPVSAGAGDHPRSPHEIESAGTRLEAAGERIDGALCRDCPRLRRRWRGLKRRARKGKPFDRGLAGLERDLAASLAAVERRRARLPALSYPASLPVSEHREEIRAALASHQVVVVCGETGSGKTTQLPKICLEAGCGRAARIGHTQPRRLAARGVATRLAAELDSPLGAVAGYKVRFQQRLDDDAPLGIMTDGILLAEIESDPELRQYDAIIVDEAHERSLNIDFLLGYLQRLLPRRPDLRVVVTSATIEPRRVAEHFGGAPVIEVSGRTYPVETRYRPLETGSGERDLQQGIADAVAELDSVGRGDILVFLPGERDIRDAADVLRSRVDADTEILPLYARLSARGQGRIFEPGSGRRIVLATNIAETSVTVPRIRYVIDSGLARISRYAARTKVQRLPIEPVSQASAEQRKGRCGRIGPGVCIRLYSEADYRARTVYTDPEIRRTNLASVILQMKLLGLGDVESFPFLDPPDRRAISDGFRLLSILGALDADRALTARGRALAQLPVEPRIGRMILAAADQGALREVLILAAALSVRDPREGPQARGEGETTRHRAFQDGRSDFLSYLHLWRDYRDRAAVSSHRELEAHCQKHGLSYPRLREWREVHDELRRLARRLGLRGAREPAGYAAVHRALLAGLVDRIGQRIPDDNAYYAPRGLRFALHPASILARRRPRWVMVAELVQTSRLYGRCAARIEPQWIEAAAGDLAQREMHEPHWCRKRSRAEAFETVRLFGLTLAGRRRRPYGPVAPGHAREIFIREGLVRGRYDSPAESIRANRRLVAEIQALEHRTRRPDLLVDEDSLVRLYDRRLPADVHDGKSFERWRRRAERRRPELLRLSRDELMAGEADAHAEAFPERIRVQGMTLGLEYRFDPAAESDGVTVTVPAPAINQLSSAPFEWLVPGLLAEKIAALIRTLPKGLRRDVVPAPDFARACAARLPERREEPLTRAIARELSDMTGATIRAEDFDDSRLPAHLIPRFRVVADDGETLAEGPDLEALRSRVGERTAAALSDATDEAWQREDIRDWDFGALPEWLAITRAGVRIPVYPGLSAEGGGVRLTLFDRPDKRDEAHRLGVRALARRRLKDRLRDLERRFPALDELCLCYAAVGSCRELCRDMIDCLLDEVVVGEAAPRDPQSFRAAVRQGRERIGPAAQQLADELRPALEAFHEVGKRLRGNVDRAQLDAARDLRAQLDRLVYPGFVSRTPPGRRPHLARYLHAAARRLDKLDRNPERDRRLQRLVEHYQGIYKELGGDAAARGNDALAHLRWAIEEYRVSLFAQELGTAEPVSDKRLDRLAQQAR